GGTEAPRGHRARSGCHWRGRGDRSAGERNASSRVQWFSHQLRISHVRTPDTTLVAAPSSRRLSQFQHRATRAAFVFAALALLSEKGSRFAMPARGITLTCGTWCTRPAPLSPVSGQSPGPSGKARLPP